jgi:FAD/FMN-containing dehydrogenase
MTKNESPETGSPATARAAAATVERLRSALRGTVLSRVSADYDDARRLFNGMIDCRPLAIVQPLDVADIREALLIAQDEHLELAVRGGGHNVAGLALVDDGIVIDCSTLRHVDVDEGNRLATCDPGVLWGELDAATHAHRLATTGGIISDTGVAGLTLGGGLGWLMGLHGLSCDNLIEAEVLLANGDLAVASEDDHKDLLWALRGGGGNFGVVTRFRFRLHPVSQVFAGSVVYPIGNCRQAMRRFVALGDSSPDELTMSFVAATEPSGVKVASLDACYCGNRAGGFAATAPLVAQQGVLRDTRGMMPYVQWQKAFNDPFRRGRRSYWKAQYVVDLSDAFADYVRDALETAPSPHTMLTIDHVHGAAARVPEDATAFAHRDLRYLFLLNTNWDEPSDDVINIEWTRRFFDELRNFGPPSAYVNYLSVEGKTRTREAYSPEAMAKLRALKARYDPSNVFHTNQNVLPTGADD